MRYVRFNCEPRVLSVSVWPPRRRLVGVGVIHAVRAGYLSVFADARGRHWSRTWGPRPRTPLR